MSGLMHIDVPREKIASFCRKHHIYRFAFFGSILREDFDADSDVDVLVEFEADQAPGLFGLTGMEIELSEILGRNVDLNTPDCLSRYFRSDVLAEARVAYAAE